MNTSHRKVRFHPMWLVLPLLATGLFGWSEASAQAGEEGVQLTVLIYSGRPNPTMQLDQGAVARLEEMLAASPANADFDADTVVPSILGYTGLLIENPSGRGKLPPRLMVYKGNLESQNGGTRFLSDENGSLEGFLVETALASGQLDADVAKVLRSEVPAGSTD